MSEALIKQAVAHYRAGETEQARQILKEVLKNEPKNEKAWLWFLQTFDQVESRIKAAKLWVRVDEESLTAREVLYRLLDLPEPGKPQRQVEELPSSRASVRERTTKKTKKRPWLLPGFLVLLVLFSAVLFYVFDQSFGAGYFPDIFNRAADDCNCTQTDAYMLRLQDRVERWQIRRSIMIFAELQGDNSTSIEQLQSIYEEEANDDVPGCLDEVHQIFLSLLDLNIKYLEAVDEDDEYSISKYELSVEIKLDELQKELLRISNEFVCDP